MPAENTEDFVVDASFVLAFLMPDETNLRADIIFNQFKSDLVKLLSSPLLTYEVANSLKIAIDRKRVDLKYAQERLEELLDYEIDFKEINFLKTLFLAEENNLTIYDASYLYLAQSHGFELLTLDQKILKLVQKLELV